MLAVGVRNVPSHSGPGYMGLAPTSSGLNP
jgi:hypothetical protein